MRHPSRLLVLVLLLCLAALPAAPQAPPDPARALLAAGPMLGAATLGETSIWLQTARPCRTQVRYWVAGRSETARLTPEVATAEAGDRIARFHLTGLEFGASYEYEVYLDGRRVPLPGPLGFRSRPFWQWRTDPPDLKVAFGSCNYVNDPPHDRPDRPYGSEHGILAAIVGERPDLMLWLGDNVYLRESDWESEAGMRRRYAHTRALPELQPLLAATHHYATWDDHDFGPGDSDRSFREREAALRVFRDYWANPSYGTAETPGVFTRFAWSDVELFLLDDRYHRSPNALPDAFPGKAMFGPAQLQWLKDALASSRATFKVVAGGNQLWNPLVYFEALGHFPAEQKELLDFLRQARVEGVVFLSGDRHHSELLKREEPGLYPLYEYTSSPLTAGTPDQAREADNPARVPGTWVMGRHSFGMLEVTGKPRERVLTFRALDVEGKEIWRHAIRQGELTFPK